MTVLHDLTQFLNANHLPSALRLNTQLASFPDALPEIQGMILVSGVYDITSHFSHEAKLGIEELSAMSRIVGKSWSI